MSKSRKSNKSQPAAPVAPVIATKRTIQKDRVTAHGITRPSKSGKCEVVWDACDTMRAASGMVPTVADIKKYASEQGWNVNNASIEYYRWRNHNGIRGRTPKAPKETPAETPAS